MQPKIFEVDAWKKTCSALPEGHCAGIDEVAVSSIAGPMTVCVAIMPKNHTIKELPIDSKKLKEASIQSYAMNIREQALFIRLFYVQADTINEYGIDYSLVCLWKKAAESVREYLPNIKIIIDGDIPIPGIQNQQAIAGGDDLDIHVSAASILAKAYTDNRMKELDKLFLAYHFASNKGYATKRHLSQIQEYGLSPVHRIKLTEYELKCHTYNEIHLSEEVLVKYIELNLGFAAHGLDFLSEKIMHF